MSKSKLVQIAPHGWLFPIAMSILPLMAGAPLAHGPITFVLLAVPALLLGFFGGVRAGAGQEGSCLRGLRALLTAGRDLPYGIRFLIITFLLTSLFALELQFDIVPNAFGMLELLAPVIVSAIILDISGGLFCAVLAILFGFFAFAPPRFTGILDIGPSFAGSLASFTTVSLASAMYFSWVAGRLVEAERCDWKVLQGALREAELPRPPALAEIVADRGVRNFAICGALIVAYGLFWSTYAFFSESTGLHIDSLEAYAWGREFLLGYYKHPPFWAWIAGLWFSVMPKTDWSFWLLSELNGALGLAGAYALMGRFYGQKVRVIGVLLLMLTPFYQFNALRFNANTGLVAIWPWTLYFFVRSIERPRIASAVACGLLAGIAMLSKYFALVLIGTCFLASLTHHNRRAYYTSAAPYVTFLVALAVFAPHLFWMFRDGFQPLIYLATKIDLRDREISNSYFQFVGASMAFFILPMAILLVARWRGGRAAAMPAPGNGPAFENIITFAPFVLTLLAGSAGHTALAVPFGVPIFSTVPLSLQRFAKAREDVALRYLGYVVIGLMAACALIAPFIPDYFERSLHHDHIMPRTQMTDAAIALWKDKTGLPLRFVSGDRIMSLAATFRSQDATSEFNSFNMRWSPEVTPDRLRRHGLLAICLEGSGCTDRAVPFLTPQTQRFDLHMAKPFKGAPVFNFTVFIVPPQQD